MAVVLLAITQPIARYVVGGLVLAIPVGILIDRARLVYAARAFRVVHGRGKDLLIVYSDSPHWKSYIDNNWLNRWRDRAVLLNRSDPNWQSRPEARLWKRLTRGSEHTPVAIVIRRRGMPHVVRFYSAFRDYKHGKVTELQRCEAHLEELLGALET